METREGATTRKLGYTPLHIACGCGHSKVAQILLGRGGNVTAESKRGGTPLLIACAESHLNVVWLLVRQNPWLVVELSK